MLYANECIFCGEHIINWAFEPFEDDPDLFSLKFDFTNK